MIFSGMIHAFSNMKQVIVFVGIIEYNRKRLGDFGYWVFEKFEKVSRILDEERPFQFRNLMENLGIS